MRINSIGNTNFKALSVRAATLGLYDSADNKTEKEKVEKIIVDQAKNSRFHVDFQNYAFVVCEAKTKYTRLNETSSQRVVEFKPVTGRIFSLEEAAQRADQLEESKKPYKQQKTIDDRFFNYTI